MPGDLLLLLNAFLLLRTEIGQKVESLYPFFLLKEADQALLNQETGMHEGGKLAFRGVREESDAGNQKDDQRSTTDFDDLTPSKDMYELPTLTDDDSEVSCMYIR